MKTITVHDMNYKPIAIISLNSNLTNSLHQYHQLMLPVPQEPMTVGPPDDGVVPVWDTFPTVLLQRVSTNKGWRTVTDAPLETLLKLPRCTKYAGDTAVNKLLGAIHQVRKEDEYNNRAYGNNKLIVLFTPAYFDELRADPTIHSLLVHRFSGSASTIHGMRYFTDIAQEVPIKFAVVV